GQRGYLLTGEERYLEPYNAARANLTEAFSKLGSLTADNPNQIARIQMLVEAANLKLDELAQTINMRRAGNNAGALDLVRSDRGKEYMERLRATIAQAENEERGLLQRRQREAQDAAAFTASVTIGGGALLLALILISAAMTSRDYLARERETWLRSGQMGMSQAVQGEQKIEVLADKVLGFLAHYLNAQVGAFYVDEGGGRMRRHAGFALDPELRDKPLHPGDGLLGQAARERRALHVTQVPADYLPVSSATGRATAIELLVAPAVADGVVYGAVELGFFRRLDAIDRELLDRVSEVAAIAVRTQKDRSRLVELLEETQRQSEELQAQQEELRVSNEELEEQGRVLKTSQAQLESQQAELEQTNSQLEEQAQLLEHQRDDLARSQGEMAQKADELERASTYKSQFLANMSHELRTPLNSTLILARLLSENKDGNLSPEQVKFAQTIYSAGNDLLVLINDILDLSKIEAGKVEVLRETLDLRKSVAQLAQSFDQIAVQKGLKLELAVDASAPAQIETDAQRLGQVLKNLLSNALKFTEKGSVVLRCHGVSAPGAPEMVAFEVRDTGIGIARDKQALVFEAFQQVDGSAHRKFGGTGLGLTISRDLARLLGGDITLQSTPGQGSVFTLTMPVQPPAPAAGERRAGELPRTEPAGLMPDFAPAYVPSTPAEVSAAASYSAAAAGAAQSSGSLAPPLVEDDRNRLTANARIILAIEDDIHFGAILRDLAHEMGFQCVIVQSASDGVTAAALYRPSAILLDMRLPDHTGLSVLDRLKHSPLTRHIPVHVVSMMDYSQEALERGAIGYALKPVNREQLVEAFRRLEAKSTQSMRRVLVVEDDDRQRESIRALLEAPDVQISAVHSGAAALEELQQTTFDCMVMDLQLPDLSGYEVLEKMARQEDTSFPPVIVYTGRSLSREEEEKLRRHSRSIIIKDARSPERLLDEVTLFLHQVESSMPPERQRMLKVARDREESLDGRRILVVEDDVRNIFALSAVLEPKGLKIQLARNGREALDALARLDIGPPNGIDLVLMDIMMPEMDGITAMREIRKRPEWKKLPIIALTAKAMKDDQEKCLAAGANDYIAKPLDVEKLLSLVRVWMPK
ncbi:MAG TPA: response regulator, partial [Burkholderiales bacterium]|nr:response regulator [Burkholderiales bacterium]